MTSPPLLHLLPLPCHHCPPPPGSFWILTHWRTMTIVFVGLAVAAGGRRRHCCHQCCHCRCHQIRLERVQGQQLLANAQANDRANSTANPRINAAAAQQRWRGRQGETKASSSSLLLPLLSNKLCASARTITKTPLANAQANDQANATTNPQTKAVAA
jgi:hypothetical protein